MHPSFPLGSGVTASLDLVAFNRNRYGIRHRKLSPLSGQRGTIVDGVDQVCRHVLPWAVKKGGRMRKRDLFVPMGK
ncbi:hypothetical protein CEXT_135461 [Caerostris extrusa]|uniref:Uncharacterized protein n=1 Tax=Caerostris extrusa TaxID=172846 RepID=A0AAV4UEK5_CAEEX|nr:hypothetical protein CEXT_135461 [Caerostris extrusa]